jgi:hypothetical protein
VRSHTDLLRVATLLAVVITAPPVYAAPVQAPVTDDAVHDLGASEIARALETVKNDPNLAREQTIKALRWRTATEQRRSTRPAWAAWIIGLFRWVEQAARVLVWVLALLMAATLGVYLTRILRTPRPTADADTFIAPSHVRDLDIRPESLPDDVGSAARLLWDRGEHRAALALLYRGMLSRLAHAYAVPILHSSTEGDCLALAAGRLTQHRLEYVSRVVLVWQRFVYGRRDTQATAVYELCDQFASALDHSLPVPSVRSGNVV